MKTFILFVLFSLSLTTYAQHPIDIQHYHFEIELTDHSDVITGRAVIKVKFLEDAAQLKFDLVSPDDEKGMRVFQVKDKDQLLTYIQSNDIVLINLTKSAKKGDVRTFEINYMGTPKDGLIISKNKHGERTFFGDNWPNRAHNWLPTNDAPIDKSSFEFVITAPSDYKVISNGIKIEETKISNNRTRTYWREETPLPTKIIVIGAAKFAVKNYADSPSAIPVSAWIYPKDSTNGFYDFGNAPSILKFFSEYIAPFPFKKLANVQSTTIFGGMENAGAIFYAENYIDGTRKFEDVIAHEIAHQWFGDMASEKSFAHLWLSEGFATYLTNFYVENKYGKDSAYKRMHAERNQVVAFAARSNKPVVDSTSDLMSLLNENSYQKGGWILHMLRKEVGDTIFRKIIQTYYHQYKGSNADSRDFENVAEKVSGKELTWFFDQWLYQPGVPELEIETKTESDELKLKIKQGKRIYQFHLDVNIETADGKKITERIFVKEKVTEFKWKGKGPVKFEVGDRDLLYSKK